MKKPQKVGVFAVFRNEPDRAVSALVSLAEAIDRFEAQGHTTRIHLIDCASHVEVAATLSSVEGAEVHSVGSSDKLGPLLISLLADDDLDFAVLADDANVVNEADLVDTVEQFDRSPVTDVVLPENGMGLCASRLECARQYFALLDDASPPVENFVSRVDRLMVLRCKPERRRRESLGASQAQLEIQDPRSFTIGANSQLGERTLVKTWAAPETIQIGKYCSGSSNVTFLHPAPPNLEWFREDGESWFPRVHGAHRPATATTFPLEVLLTDAPYDNIPQDRSVLSKPQTIGNDVWLGYGATIIGPVTVGDGAIIGAGAMVTTDVPPYAVVMGNPAKIVRYRFSKEVISRLLEIKWWDWPEETVLANYQWFQQPIEAFIDHFSSDEPT